MTNDTGVNVHLYLVSKLPSKAAAGNVPEGTVGTVVVTVEGIAHSRIQRKVEIRRWYDCWYKSGGMVQVQARAGEEQCELTEWDRVYPETSMASSLIMKMQLNLGSAYILQRTRGCTPHGNQNQLPSREARPPMFHSESIKNQGQKTDSFGHEDEEIAIFRRTLHITWINLARHGQNLDQHGQNLEGRIWITHRRTFRESECLTKKIDGEFESSSYEAAVGLSGARARGNLEVDYVTWIQTDLITVGVMHRLWKPARVPLLWMRKQAEKVCGLRIGVDQASENETQQRSRAQGQPERDDRTFS
ncbi:hypothetical protein B0H13DRAFT_2410448 [Mycena leptocephala]|nr:hypothetical protein B0H13DRAFT_2410448 [Mycena leptocephala]